MTVEQMREVLTARPFRPFVLETSDGNRLEVRHPENMMLLGAGRTVVVAKDDATAKIVDLLHVTAIDFPNGKPSRKPRN